MRGDVFVVPLTDFTRILGGEGSWCDLRFVLLPTGTSAVGTMFQRELMQRGLIGGPPGSPGNETETCTLCVIAVPASCLLVR